MQIVHQLNFLMMVYFLNVFDTIINIYNTLIDSCSDNCATIALNDALSNIHTVLAIEL